MKPYDAIDPRHPADGRWASLTLHTGERWEGPWVFATHGVGACHPGFHNHEGDWVPQTSVIAAHRKATNT